MKKLSNI